jgi:hypothetical protein
LWNVYLLLPPYQITIRQNAPRLWLTRCREGSPDQDPLGRGSFERNECHVRLHVNPFIGYLRLTQLTVPRVREFEDEPRAAKRSRH